MSFFNILARHFISFNHYNKIAMKNLFQLLFLPTLLLLCCLFFVTSCAEEKLQENPAVLLDASLGIEQHQLDLLQGKTVLDNHLIRYWVTADKGNYYLKFSIDNQSLEAWINFEEETLTHDGHKAVLTTAQKEVLLKFANRFGEALVNSNGNTRSDFEIGQMEYSFLRTVEYWSQAPQGYVHTHQVITVNTTAAKSTRNDGVTCIKKNNRYTLKYTDRNNTVITRNRKAGYDGGGSYDCMGRCGASCGSFWIPSAWTLDCFEHDQCSLELNASGGASDPSCGDEFTEAADDYIWGVLRGCRG